MSKIAIATIYNSLLDINSSWDHRGSVDWSEAEQIVNWCELLRQEAMLDSTALNRIITYAHDHEEWDSEEVSCWPTIITQTIDSSDKVYQYREDGDNWEVYSQTVIGEEEWKATVETELAAQHLIKLYMPQHTVERTSCNDQDL